MFAMGDSPKTAKRRVREKRTISQMVALYCAGNHDAAAVSYTHLPLAIV